MKIGTCLIFPPAGADASAIHYSLIETAKTHGLEPYAYLNAVFKALPYADTIDKIEDLLPWNFKKSSNYSTGIKILGSMPFNNNVNAVDPLIPCFLQLDR